MPRLAAKHDRWLALGLLGLVLLLLYVAVIHPWWSAPLAETQVRIASLHEREQRIDAQLRQADEVQQRLQEVSEQLAGQPGFLPESTAELATAGLVQKLEMVVEQASPGQRSCAIVNRSPLTRTGNERFQRVAIQARLRCGTAEVASILHLLESGSPRLFVDDLNMLSQRYSVGPGSGGLDVGFTLYGYLSAVHTTSPGGIPGREKNDAH